MLRDDLAHRRLGLRELLGRERPDVAAHDRLLGDDVRLAGRACRRSCAGVELTSVPPSTTPGLNVRYCCPTSRSRNAWRMRAASNSAPAPTSSRKICDECAGVPVVRSVHDRRAAPRDDRRVRIARARPRSLTPPAIASPLRRALARAASSGAPASSSSPCITTVMFRPSSSARRLERPERLDDDDVPTLHVDDAGAARGRVAQPLEFLKRAARLEHRVEVSDQQKTRAAPVRSATRCPARLKRPRPPTSW